RLEPPRIDGTVVAGGALVQGEQLALVERDPLERIDEHGAVGGAGAHQEMTRVRDPAGVDADPPADLDQYDPQRDGDPRPPVEHLVEEAVARVVVVARVSVKAEVAVE